VQKYSFRVIQGLLILVLALVLPATSITWGKSKTKLSPAAKAGQEVFQQNCAMCHFANQAKNKIGPGLKGILKNKELPFSHKPATVANVRDQIEKGNPEGKPMPMPPFGSKLSKADMSNLIAYLKTL
jgi:cytochrome c2